MPAPSSDVVAMSLAIVLDITEILSPVDKVFEADFGTEGLDMYMPGNGIRFTTGVHATITNTTSVTLGYTG